MNEVGNRRRTGALFGPDTSMSGLAEFVAFCAVFLVVDCAVLRWIFPRYLDPLWPHHSDFYMPAAMAYSPAGFVSVLHYPRPVGQVFFWVIGHLKTRLSMFAVLLLVAGNYALAVQLGRRLLQPTPRWTWLLSAALFAYLLASHPYQYQMSTWDAFAELSLFLLLSALWARLHGMPLVGCFVLVLLAFLSKETYILSVGFLSVIWLVLKRFKRDAFYPMLIIGVTAILAMGFEHVMSSPFTNGASEHGGPYEIVLTLKSVFSQWLMYSEEGLNWLSCATVIAAIIAVAFRYGASSQLLWSISFPIAGLLSLLPNSVLPNHHFAGYSWDASYFFFAPVLFVAGIAVGNRKAWVVAAVAVLAGLFSPYLSKGAFEQQSWITMNQKRQKVFLQTFGGLIKTLQSPKKVLISGVNFPYTMFLYKQSVRSFEMPAGTQLFVVRYDNQNLPFLAASINQNSEVVQTIAPADVEPAAFDEAWLVRDDGSLIQRIVSPSKQSEWIDRGFSNKETTLYPMLGDIFGPGKTPGDAQTSGTAYLDCGMKLLDYNAVDLSKKCLLRAKSDLPGNPYPVYYLGVASERLGNLVGASEAYKRAIALASTEPNPAFQAALSRVEAAKNATAKP